MTLNEIYNNPYFLSNTKVLSSLQDTIAMLEELVNKNFPIDGKKWYADGKTFKLVDTRKFQIEDDLGRILKADLLISHFDDWHSIQKAAEPLKIGERGEYDPNFFVKRVN